MLYNKSLLYKKSKELRMNYTTFSKGMNSEIDDNLLPHKQARLCYNYNIKDGSLKCGYGFEDLKLPKKKDNLEDERVIERVDGGSVLAIWLFRWYDTALNERDYHYCYYDTNNEVRFNPIFCRHNIEGTVDQKFTSKPCAFNFKKGEEMIMVFCSATDDMCYLNRNGSYIVQSAPHMVSACVHYDRVFAILAGELSKIIFSANLDVTNWNISLDEAGYIDLADERGDLKKVLSFNDYIYVFRDYGVTRLSAYGEQTDFSVTNMFISGVKIFSESVVICEDKVLYLAADGIHVFNGASEQRLELGIENLLKDIKNDDCCAVFYRGNYFLACRMNFDDGIKVGCENEEGYVNNVLLELDLKTFTVSITRGVDIVSLMALEDAIISKLVASFRGKYKMKLAQLTEDGLMFGEPLLKVWTSPMSNFSQPNQLKIVKEVILKTESDMKVRIRTDREEKVYSVKGSNSTKRIKTNVRGELVEVSFITDTACLPNISSPQLVVDVI